MKCRFLSARPRATEAPGTSARPGHLSTGGAHSPGAKLVQRGQSTQCLAGSHCGQHLGTPPWACLRCGSPPTAATHFAAQAQACRRSRSPVPRDMPSAGPGHLLFLQQLGLQHAPLPLQALHGPSEASEVLWAVCRRLSVQGRDGRRGSRRLLLARLCSEGPGTLH